MIRRFSSRRERLDTLFLNERLASAVSYDRIAGYFSSSVFEVAGEAIENITGPVRMICNSDLLLHDVATAKAAQMAIRREWCAAEPEKLGPGSKVRFQKLYDLLKSGKLEVRVLPRSVFGLIHGKAGVVTWGDGSKTSFMGSANETRAAWQLNYELVWEDDSPEAVTWVQEEFDALWQSPHAQPLADFVMEDLGRLAKRTVIAGVEDWRKDPEPAAIVVEAPVYRQDAGLWPHQKYFAKLAFDAHLGPHGARFVLGDMVGLGKTVQLAMAAQLMALAGDKPVLVIAPKTLLWQWQDELNTLLDMPSAVWNGKQWVDEQGIEYPVSGSQGIVKCPRRTGIVSQGLIVAETEAADYLKSQKYECIIVDEAHRARRKKFGPTAEKQKSAEPNNLMAFLLEVARQTKSLLLATATPVQIHRVEAYDLLTILSQGTNSVLGNPYSEWRTQVGKGLDLVMGQDVVPVDLTERFNWITNPLPPSGEDREFYLLRQALNVKPDTTDIPGDYWLKLNAPGQERIRRIGKDFFENHNPYIRHIIRRTRDYLENTLDPETNEPYLKPIRVELLGEDSSEAISVTPYLQDAFDFAETFCQKLGERVKGSGFLKTLLLRRVGSTIYAGRQTAEKMLHDWNNTEEIEEADDDVDEAVPNIQVVSEMKQLTGEERQLLQSFVTALSGSQDQDPKYQVVLECLQQRGWLNRGCIVFSQYYDSVWWLAQQLSREMPAEPIGIYAGGQRSGIMLNQQFVRETRENLKAKVRSGEIRLMLGTDAASEGLNLQRLGTLINLDLPWNPTRLEQRKGRIQRIGQVQEVVYIYNMRYKGSVEDRVHELLSQRLQEIHQLFGQLPDTLEDVWVNVALGEIKKAQDTIDEVPHKHPFQIRYQKIEKVEWESCTKVLDKDERRRWLMQGW